MITEVVTSELAGDALRVHRASEHCRSLATGILSVHAVAMVRDGRGVVLLGGHGAGKSVTGLALAARGWHALAGDVVLVQLEDKGNRVTLTGGTRRFLLRPTSAAALDSYGSSAPTEAFDPTARTDVTNVVTWVALDSRAIEAHLAVNVAVDSGAGPATALNALDAHTSQSIWWRASSYLIDRVLDDPSAVPLRCMECPALATTRMQLTRLAARLVPVHEGFGTADGIAGAIDSELTKEQA
jgi:hypothetical protein